MGRSYYSRAFVANADKLTPLEIKKTRWIFEKFAEENLYQFGWGTETTNYYPTLEHLTEFSEMCPNISFYFLIRDEDGELTIYGLRYENEKLTILKNMGKHYYSTEKAYQAMKDFIKENNLTEIDHEF